MTDAVKGLLLTVGFTLVLLYPIVWILSLGGPFLWAYLWGFVFVVGVFLVTLKPVLIDPLFNSFEPLPEGEIRERVERLARRVSFPLSKLFVVDGSKRSSHSNAYFFGLIEKRIVIFDTLLQNVDADQAEAVIAHELGHWSCGHTRSNVLIGQVYFGIFIYLAVQLMYSPELFTSFGFPAVTPPVIGLMLFSYTFSPLDALISFLMNCLSRHFEYQADAFAVSLGYGRHLASGLVRMSSENLGNLNPDCLYSIYHHSHPTIVERLEHIRSMKLD